MSKQSLYIEAWHYQINRFDYLVPDSMKDHKRLREIRVELREIVKRDTCHELADCVKLEE